MEITPLCELAYLYGTDKCPSIKHSYTPYYYKMLRKKKWKFKKILEIGIGLPENMHHSRFYRTGASLYMWRDFFPRAKIYGIDILPKAMIYHSGVETFLCDATNKNHLDRLIHIIGSDIDMVIDDGSHVPEDQIFSAKTLMPMLKDKVLYIIEDVTDYKKVVDGLEDYDCEVVKFGRRRDDNLIIVRRKE